MSALPIRERSIRDTSRDRREVAYCAIGRHAERVYDLLGQRPVEPMIALSGRDPQGAVRELAPLYSGVGWYCRPVDEQFWFKYVAVGDDLVSLRRLQMHGFLSGTASTGEDIVVHWLEHGRGRVTVGGDPIPSQSAATPTVLPVGRQFRIEYEDWDQRLIHVRHDFLLDVAAEDDVAVDGALIFDTSVAPSSHDVGRWHQSLRRAVEAFRSDGPQSVSWLAARRDVARALLQLYPLREATPAPVGSSADGRVAAAVRYVHAHAKEPLTVVDLARVAGLSVRGLQEAFRREVQTTPLAYVREVRLEMVRSELQAAAPRDEVVATIARRWGFSHLGRFASTYRARYGEYPHETLRLPHT